MLLLCGFTVMLKFLKFLLSILTYLLLAIIQVSILLSYQEDIHRIQNLTITCTNCHLIFVLFNWNENLSLTGRNFVIILHVLCYNLMDHFIRDQLTKRHFFFFFKVWSEVWIYFVFLEIPYFLKIYQCTNVATACIQNLLSLSVLTSVFILTHRSYLRNLE